MVLRVIAADRGPSPGSVRRWRRPTSFAALPPTSPTPTSPCACACGGWFPRSSTPGRWTRACVARSAAEPLPTAAELVREAGRLAAALPDAGWAPARERFLAGQLRAVEWRARRLAGQPVSFAGEVRRCLGRRGRPR